MRTFESGRGVKTAGWLCLLLFCPFCLWAFQPRPLYPGGPENTNGLSAEPCRDDTVNQVRFGASSADYFLFLPDPQKATGQAVVICPGGGYSAVVYGQEGFSAARWLNGQGVAAVVLRYRMPNHRPYIPLSDVREMFRVVRRNASEWGIDPGRVGVMGFSSGGHLAALASVRFDGATRPDFAVLVYAATMTAGPYADPETRDNLLSADAPADTAAFYSADLYVSPRTPPVFLAHSFDDDGGVPPQNSTLFFDALQRNGVRSELHVYPSGGHGWAWKEGFPYRDEFTAALGRWLREL